MRGKGRRTSEGEALRYKGKAASSSGFAGIRERTAALRERQQQVPRRMLVASSLGMTIEKERRVPTSSVWNLRGAADLIALRAALRGSG